MITVKKKTKDVKKGMVIDMKEEKGRVLGVDYGDVRTGLAVSDEAAFLAGGIGYIRSSYDREVAKKVAEAAKEHGVCAIVIGNPVNMNGTLGPRADKIKAFYELLSEYTDLPIHLYDERLSTAEAHRYLSAGDVRGKKRRAVVDSLSAQIILQDYLDKKRAENKRGEV